MPDCHVRGSEAAWNTLFVEFAWVYLLNQGPDTEQMENCNICLVIPPEVTRDENVITTHLLLHCRYIHMTMG